MTFKKEQRIGEVVTSETTTLVAESKNSSIMPLLGEFCLIEYKKDLIVGIVSHQGYEPKDLRMPLALGLTPDELRTEQPQIANQIRNLFHILILGCLQDIEPIHFIPFLPASPAPIHSFIFQLDTKNEQMMMTDNGFWLALIDEVRKDESFDHLFLALVGRQLQINNGNKNESWDLLHKIGRMVAKGLHDQTARMNSLLRRMALLER